MEKKTKLDFIIWYKNNSTEFYKYTGYICIFLLHIFRVELLQIRLYNIDTDRTHSNQIIWDAVRIFDAIFLLFFLPAVHTSIFIRQSHKFYSNQMNKFESDKQKNSIR